MGTELPLLTARGVLENNPEPSEIQATDEILHFQLAENAIAHISADICTKYPIDIYC